MEYANGQEWRERVSTELSKIGIVSFDPYNKPFVNAFEEDNNTRARLKALMKNGEYDEVAKWMKEVRIFDLRLCDLADFLIIRIVPEIASWGSAEEIYWSNRMKKPMFIAIEGGKEKTPLWLMGTVPHRYIYNNVEEIVDTLKKINSGEIKIDSSRWRLLKPEFR